MLRIILVALLSSCFSIGMAQCSYSRITQLYSGEVYLEAFDADASGNAYIVARYHETPRLASNVWLSYGENDAFVAGYSPTGKLKWAKPLQSDFTMANDVSVDTLGNIFVTGSYDGTLTVGNKSVSGSPISGQVFTLKLDSSGNVKWLRTSAGNPTNSSAGGQDLGYHVTPDNKGGCYVSGDFTDDFSIGGYFVTGSNGGYNGFLARYNTAGTVTWAHSVARGDMRPDGQGGFYIAAPFYKSGYFNSATLLQTPEYAVVVAHGDSLGKFDWIKIMHGAITLGSMSVTDKGTIGIAGTFIDTLALDSHHVHSEIHQSVYIVNLDRSGKMVRMGKLVTTQTPPPMYFFVAPDGLDYRASDGSIALAGEFEDNANFNGIVKSSPGRNFFFAEYDSLMNVRWVISHPFTNQWKSISGVRYNKRNTMYACGPFAASLTFSPLTINPASGGMDFYIAEFYNGAVCYNTLSTDHVPGDMELAVHPVPAYDRFTVKVPGAIQEPVNVRVFDMKGNLVTTIAAEGSPDIEVDCSLWPAGLYLLQMIAPGGTTTTRIQKY